MSLVQPFAHALPPSIPWNSIDEMFADVLLDFKDEISRNYLLGVDPVQDLITLTTSHPENNEIPRTFNCNIDTRASNGFQGTITDELSIFIPNWTIRNSTGGVCITHASGQGAVQEIYTKPKRTARYVANSVNSSTLTLFLDSDQLDLCYCIAKNGWRLHVCAWFDRKLFLQAFNTPQQINTQLILKSLVKTIVGGFEVSSKIRANIALQQPLHEHEIVGYQYFFNTVSLYADSVAMLTIPVYAAGIFNIHADKQSIREIREWAIRKLIHCLPMTPLNLPMSNIGFPITESSYSSTSPVQSIENSSPISMEGALSPSVACVPIAPAPLIPTARTAEEVELEKRNRKAERRRIQNRLAAARSNARRREAKILARQAAARQEVSG